MKTTQNSSLPILGFSPDDIPAMTNGVISRTRVYEDMARGLLRAKKAGKRDIITPEEARRYINSLPDRLPTKPAA
jgi:hypothetical protein